MQFHQRHADKVAVEGELVRQAERVRGGHPLRLLLSRPEGMITAAQLTAAALEAILSDRDGPPQKPEGIAISAAAPTD